MKAKAAPFYKLRPYGKLFFSVLATYLLMLAVVLSLLLIGYVYSIRQSRKDAEVSQVVFLQQVQRELDLRLGNVTDVSNLLASHPLAKAVSQISDEQPEYQLSYRELNQAVADQNNLIAGEAETVLYFQNSDSVLTGKSRYRSENLDAYSRTLGLAAEEFRGFVSPEQGRGAYAILHPNTSQAALAYLEPILDSSYQRVGMVVSLISMSRLYEALNVGEWAAGSVCCMINGDSSLYIDEGGYGDTGFLLEFSVYQQPALDATPTVLELGGKKFVTVALRSVGNGWSYYFSVPLESFYQKSNVYILLFVLALCSSVLFGVVLSLLFSHRFSQPVNKILQALHLNTAAAYPEAIHSLADTVSSYQASLSTAQSQLRWASRQQKSTFLYNLCQGSLTLEQAEKGIRGQGIPLGDVHTIFLLLDYHDTDRSIFFQNGFLDSEMLLYASCNVVEELLCPESGAVFTHDGRTFCLYQPREGLDTALLRERLEKVYHFHKDVLCVSLHILAAGPGGLADLPELFLETEEMAQYKLFWNQDVPDILFYDEISNFNDLDSTFDSLDAEKRFLNLLAIKDYENAHKMLMQRLDLGLSKDLRHFRRERYRIYGFVSSLLESLPDLLAREGADPEGEGLAASLDSLLAAKSLEELRWETDRLFQDIIAYQEKSRCADSVPWVKEVRGYIEAHYTEPQLDVSYLAEVFHLNVSHLSRTYKKTTSIGVLDNIHMVRISKAKELLAQGMSVQETSAKVGYLESRTLIRAFKRYESMTPGQYQEMSLRPKPSP